MDPSSDAVCILSLDSPNAPSSSADTEYLNRRQTSSQRWTQEDEAYDRLVVEFSRE